MDYHINAKQYFIGKKLLEFLLAEKIINIMKNYSGNQMAHVLNKITNNHYCKTVCNELQLISPIANYEIFLKVYIGNEYLKNNTTNVIISKIVDKFCNHILSLQEQKTHTDPISILQEYTQKTYGCLPHYVVQKQKNKKYKITLYVKQKRISSITEISSIRVGKKQLAQKFLSNSNIL